MAGAISSACERLERPRLHFKRGRPHRGHRGRELTVALLAVDGRRYEAGVSYEIRPSRPSDLSGVVGTIRDVTSEAPYIIAAGVAEQRPRGHARPVGSQPLSRRVRRHGGRRCRRLGPRRHVRSGRTRVDGRTHARRDGDGRRRGIGSHRVTAGSNGPQAVAVGRCTSPPATNERAIDVLTAVGWTTRPSAQTATIGANSSTR